MTYTNTHHNNGSWSTYVCLFTSSKLLLTTYAGGIFGLLSLILVAGGLLLALFILLAGAVDGKPVNQWYFLQADTSNIPGAPALSRWTFWNICDGSGGSDLKTGALGAVKAARPLDPPSGRNFGTTTGVPAAFIGTRYYFYMTRFMFAFALIALFFGACALFTGLLALCTRLGSYLSGLLTTLAFIFQALTAALMTYVFVFENHRTFANDKQCRLRKGPRQLPKQWTNCQYR